MGHAGRATALSGSLESRANKSYGGGFFCSRTPFVCCLQFGDQTTQAHAGDTCTATAIAKSPEISVNNGGPKWGGPKGGWDPPPPVAPQPV